MEFPAHPIVGVGAVIVQAGKALVVKRAHDPRKGEWSLPGGRVELGESLVDAARREMLEETGLAVEVGQIIEVFDRIHRHQGAVRYHFVIVDFLCTVVGGSLCAGDDADDVAWVDGAEAERYGVNEHALRVLRRGLELASRVSGGSATPMSSPVIRQAGAVVYRQGVEREFLLVRPRRTPNQWIFPKGHLEEGESSRDAALREAREEAGVIGRIVHALEPRLSFDFNGRSYEVEYFLVEALDATPEYERREQTWLPGEAALINVTHAAAKGLLRTAIAVLQER